MDILLHHKHDDRKTNTLHIVIHFGIQKMTIFLMMQYMIQMMVLLIILKKGIEWH